jgi:hypothetical protein
MFFLPRGLSNEETEIIFKNYNKFLKTAHEKEKERKLKIDEEKKKEVAAQKRKEKLDEMIKHLAKNPSTSFSTMMAYSMILRE